MNRGRFGKRKHFNFRNKDKSGPNKEYQYKNQLKETDAGITQFVSSFEGFSGVIKARFSDFHVNEIDLDGNVAKLTDRSIPKNPQDEKAAFIPESPLAYLPQEIWDSIKKVSDKSIENVEMDVSTLDKGQRTEIHETLRKYFGRKVCANTENRGDKKIMNFKKFDGRDTVVNWPKDRGEYVHFLVYKECLDTLETTLKIANCVKIPASSFNYAGVKDKRAKTTQWFSVRKVEPWKLLIKTKCLRNVKIGNVTFKDQPLKLGLLKGNKFRIALRNVSGDDSLIEKSLSSLKEKGFINYYGLQRFGNDKEVPTFSIGVQLLLGNWKEACEIILKPTESDRPEFDITQAKKIYASTKNAKKALDAFTENKKTSIEYLLLEGLSKGHENDYVNALSSIPRNMRLLYLHSFQSLVWNSVASKRIEKFGLDVVEGDLIIVKCEETESNDNEEEKKTQVRALTSQECSSYSIYDVVLPLPGYAIEYPKHLEIFYKEIVERFGLTLEMTQQKVREYSLSGSYRKLMGRVQNLTWKRMHYNDPNENLIRSDFEELRGCEEPTGVENGAYKALVLEFCLDASSYATMVLREVLKTDTSSSAHAKLNNYHVEEKTEEAEEDSESVGLLADNEKYEAFKNLVFGNETLKRKNEEEHESVKVAKI